jgi:hypothetical protein
MFWRLTLLGRALVWIDRACALAIVGLTGGAAAWLLWMAFDRSLWFFLLVGPALISAVFLWMNFRHNPRLAMPWLRRAGTAPRDGIAVDPPH